MAPLLASIVGADAERVAARLIAEFGTLAKVMAEPEALIAVDPTLSPVADYLGHLRAASLAAARETLRGPVLSTAPAVIEYLQLAIAPFSEEQLRVLYLDAAKRLLADEVAALGATDRITAYPSAILRRALLLGANGLILAHNHPSGNPEPSRADLDLTKRIADAARTLSMTVFDHLIVAGGHAISLRQRGYL